MIDQRGHGYKKGSKVGPRNIIQEWLQLSVTKERARGKVKKRTVKKEKDSKGAHFV